VFGKNGVLQREDLFETYMAKTTDTNTKTELAPNAICINIASVIRMD